MKQQLNEIKRMKKLAMIKENLENDDIIYNALLDMDHEQLVSHMLIAAESDSSLTLIDYLRKYDIDNNTWTDPAGGTHYGNEDDPAAMYK